MKKLTPYQLIVRAAKKGCGLRLSADQVAELAIDHAIYEGASEDDGEGGIMPEAIPDPQAGASMKRKE